MITLTRQQVLDVLQGDWATYVQRFRGLSPEARSAFLAKQDYASFSGLLFHIVAWWEVGYHNIEKFLTEPAFESREYDVDAFNAEAVAKSASMDEEEVIKSFEKMRLFLIEFVKALPEAAFENERVVKQFKMELVGHLNDHNVG